MPVRPETEARVDALHAEIAELLAAECEHYDQTHPDANNPLHRHIAHTKIRWLAHDPVYRKVMERFCP